MLSPLKSPTSAIENVVGTLPSGPSDNTAAPFINQIDVSPAPSRHTSAMSPHMDAAKHQFRVTELVHRRRPFSLAARLATRCGRAVRP
jgi:hypothetical protein